MLSPSNIEDMKVDGQIKISVCDPQKIGEGMSSYVVYKVTTKTYLPYFKKNIFSVSRRFSDFLGLHNKLVERHLDLGIIVPPAPEKSVVGMTKVKASKVESVLSDDFIEKRRAALERYINRTASHPVLRADSELLNFLQNESDLPRATKTFALSGAGVLRFFSRIEETASKMIFKIEETDPWFVEKPSHIEKLDQEMRKMHSIAEAGIDHRKGISTSIALFAKSAALMGGHEEDCALSKLFSQLAEVEEKMEPLELQRANCDFYLLSELLNDYIGLIAVVKKVFHRRVKRYQTLMQAQGTLSEKRKQLEFSSISKTIRNEIERFEQTMLHDFETTIIKYVEQLLETHRQMLKYWEEFLPEAQTLA